MGRRDDSPLIVLNKGNEEEEVSASPLYRQVYARIRGLILEERFVAGDRLPSSRALARDLDVSRTTVELAFDQLLAEGFIERKQGSGTFVADVVPDRPRSFPEVGDSMSSTAVSALPESGHRMLQTPLDWEDGPVPPGFTPCRPEEDAFPIDLWNRTLTRTVRERGRAVQHAAPPGGDSVLRNVLAAHLARTRGVQCTPEQIVITSGTQQSLDVLSRLLLDPEDSVWMEEPGYLGARAALQAAGARLTPIPVDEEGIDVEAGQRLAPKAQLAYVTPSHQYPSGVTLSIARRLELLGWAAETNAWIIEDDYDSEFRHAGRPLAPLQSIDRSGCVIYLGTFNKALFVGLRLGYVVLPSALVQPFTQALEVAAGPVATILQAALAAFIADGHFVSHLRRSRIQYRARRDALLEAIDTSFEGTLRLGPSETGLHVCAYLPESVADTAVSEEAAGIGLHVPPLSRYYLGPDERNGLVLGYGGVDEDSIRAGIQRLARVAGLG